MSDVDSIKICGKCGLDKPVSAFYRRSDGNGYRSECKACMCKSSEAKLAKLRDQYPENREKIIDYQREYRSKNATKLRAEAMERYKNNRDARRQTMLEYRKKNSEELKQKRDEFRRSNPEILRARDSNKRARRLAAPGKHTSTDIRSLFRLQSGLCVACRTGILHGYHVDHIIPLSRGGSNDKTNLQLLCPSCNMSKHARDPVEFMQSRGFLI